MALIIIYLYGIGYTTENEMLGQNIRLGLLLIYLPIIYFVQGFICAMLRDNVFLSLGLTSTIVMMNIFIWSSNNELMRKFIHVFEFLWFVIMYYLIGLIGFGLTWLIKITLKYILQAKSKYI